MRNSDCVKYLECLAEAAKLNIKMDCNRCAKEGRFIMTAAPKIERDKDGNVIIPEGFIYQPEITNKRGKVVKEYLRKYGYGKKKTVNTGRDYKAERKRRKERKEALKRDTSHISKEGHFPIFNLSKKTEMRKIGKCPQITKASPAEIIVALRKGMAQEIVDMIIERFEL
jgi:hypothetical protein